MQRICIDGSVDLLAVYTLQCANVVQDSGINTVMCHGRCIEQFAHKIAVCSVKCVVYSVQCGINIAVQCTIPVFSVQCSAVQCGERRGAGNGKFVPGEEGGHCETTSL